MLPLGASGEGVGILLESFSVPCSPRRLSSGRSELLELAATTEGSADITAARALRHLSPCTIFKQVTSGLRPY